jgi:hypothetical protein
MSPSPEIIAELAALPTAIPQGYTEAFPYLTEGRENFQVFLNTEAQCFLQQISLPEFDEIRVSEIDTNGVKNGFENHYNLSDGFRTQRCFHKDEKMHGECENFDPETHHLVFRDHYKNGVENGVSEEFDRITGRLTRKTTWFNGKAEGAYLEFDKDDGLLTFKATYKNDVLDGRAEEFIKGECSKRVHYKEGQLHGSYELFHKGRRIIDTYYEDGLRHGLYKTFDPEADDVMTTLVFEKGVDVTQEHLKRQRARLALVMETAIDNVLSFDGRQGDDDSPQASTAPTDTPQP